MTNNVYSVYSHVIVVSLLNLLKPTWSALDFHCRTHWAQNVQDLLVEPHFEHIR